MKKAIVPNDPFGWTPIYAKFGINFWATGELSDPTNTHGANASYQNLCVGVFNTADNFSVNSGGTNAGSSLFNTSPLGYVGPGNSYAPTYTPVAPSTAFNTPSNPATGNISNNDNGNQSGPDLLGDVTVLNTAVAFNAVFAADNTYTGQGSIGLYGRSRGSDFSIGVLDQSPFGCAVYGLALGVVDAGLTKTATEVELFQGQIKGYPPFGVGVVGRSMGGEPTEKDSAANSISVENIVQQAIGVLGHSTSGPGVRGHGGTLLPKPYMGDPLSSTPLFSTSIQPGGVFSSGKLAVQPVVGGFHLVSEDLAAQLRLTPSITSGVSLPNDNNIGDFFLRFIKGGTVELWICCSRGEDQQSNMTTCYWQQVSLGTPQPAYSPVSLPLV